MPKKEKPARGRDWNAVAAHFRRGGPMRHKNTPRGGAGADSLVEEGLDELEEETNESRPSGEGDDRDG